MTLRHRPTDLSTLAILACLLIVPVRGQEPTVTRSAPRVGVYEKIEFTIGLQTRYANPFDPNEVDLQLDLTTPSGSKQVVPAYWHQPFDERQIPDRGRSKPWYYPAGAPQWRARFAPNETGKYRGQARLRDWHGTRESQTFEFESVASEKRGFVRTSKDDPRYLEFSSGQSFFPIGQNLAFVGETQYFDVARLAEAFGKIAENGGNYVRIWTCCEDWALAVESRKSAWGRSWSWNPPLGLIGGQDGYLRDAKCVVLKGNAGDSLAMSPCRPIAVRPETRYVLSGRVRLQDSTLLAVRLNGTRLGESLSAEGVRREPNRGRWEREITTGKDEYWLPRLDFQLDAAGSASLYGLSLREAGGGAELLGEADVDRPVLGHYNPLDCFQLDRIIEAAERRGIYLQLCLLTRDLYMHRLSDVKSGEYGQAVRQARHFLRYAVARWGFSTHVAAWEYFNEMNPSLPTDRFYDELGKYLEEIDVNRHLRTTSAWGPAPKDWRHPRIDVAQLHWYLRPAWGELWKDEAAAVADRARLVKQHAENKPAMLAEFGLAGDQWQLSPHMKNDRNLVHFRHSLWASSLSGLSGSAMFWWWENLDRQNAYVHYRPIARFLADLPAGRKRLNLARAAVSPANVQVAGLQCDDRAWLWLCNSQSSWYRQVVDGQTPATVKQAKLKLEGFGPGEYRLTWWDPQTGQPLGDEPLAPSGPSLEVAVPEFADDIACQVARSPGPR